MNKRLILSISMIYLSSLIGCGRGMNESSPHHNPIVQRFANADISLNCEIAHLIIPNVLVPIAQVGEKAEKWNEHMEEVHIYVGKEENLTGESDNPYFYPMFGEEATKTVYLEMRAYTDQFIGAATLHILPLQGIPGKGSYYKLYFTDYVGICESHNEFYWDNASFSPCYFWEEEQYREEQHEQLYFYVEEDRIYQLFITSEDELREGGSEPWKDTIYRLVCANEGMEETIDTSYRDYHEGVRVEGDERRYSLYPGDTSGTSEYQYITWKEGQGITSYMNWSGNNKTLLSFSDSDDIYGHGTTGEDMLMQFYYHIY